MKFLFFSFIIITLVTCQSPTENSKKDYTLIKDDDGILVEQFDSTVVDENKYNKNNIIYTVGSKFKYDFKHITPSNETKFYRIKEDRQSWDFVVEDSKDSSTIKLVIIQVISGNPMADYLPDYNQTGLSFKYKEDGLEFSFSGAIENEANVWIHPPRDQYFEILEINPFPYIKSPYEIGNKWNWNLKIGDGWADKRWKIWEGQIENEYSYEIIDKKKIDTKLGELDCYVIDSKAKSRIGETSLLSYFNLKYGFVKLDYTNIDGSKTILELSEYSSE